MKKWLVFLFVLLVVLLIGIQWVLPRDGGFVKSERVRCNVDGANRRICLDTVWRKWWPWESGYTYRVTQRFNREVDWMLEKEDWRVPCKVMLLSDGAKDSFELRVETQQVSGFNPFERIKQYRMREPVDREMGAVFASLRAFLEKPENIYGMDVRSEMATDSMLIVSEMRTVSYPSTADIYQRIGEMRGYAFRHGARETNPPMLHVMVKEGGYESMMAIPVDKEIKGNGVFYSRKFVPWKVLTGEVRGGVHVAERAFMQLQLYVQDYGKTAMAIPFQSLVTERDKEADTSKWVTRVVVPVP